MTDVLDSIWSSPSSFEFYALQFEEIEDRFERHVSTVGDSTTVFAGVTFISDSPLVTTVDSPVRTKFKLLADAWRRETVFDSGYNLTHHWAYQQIIGMGPQALPMILADLNDHSSHWFWALYSIVGQDIAIGITDFDDASRAWLAWGAEHGLI
jgi:hypothetical protein